MQRTRNLVVLIHYTKLINKREMFKTLNAEQEIDWVVKLAESK